MQAVIDAIINLVLGVFSLTETDWIIIGINMIMGLSMFLPMTVGQLSFGQAGFMSIGAHIAVVLALYAGVWFPLALLIAGIGTGIVGVLIGVPVLRLRGLLLWAFRDTVDENILVPQTLKWVKENYPWVKKAAILSDIKDAYSKSLGQDTFRVKLKEFGIEVVEDVDYVTGDTDFSAHITKLGGTV